MNGSSLNGDVNNSELGKEVQFKLKVPPLFDNGIASARDRVGLHCLIKRGRRSCSYAAP